MTKLANAIKRVTEAPETVARSILVKHASLFDRVDAVELVKKAEKGEHGTKPTDSSLAEQTNSFEMKTILEAMNKTGRRR